SPYSTTPLRSRSSLPCDSPSPSPPFSPLPSLFSSFFYCSCPPPALPSFPTRRSSDLNTYFDAGEGNDLSGQLPYVDLSSDEYSLDRKSTRLNSSHVSISYAVFCLKKKK